MAKYTFHGDTYYQITDANQPVIFDQLPKGTYTIKYDEMKQAYYFCKVEDLTLPSELYGSTTSRSQRIFQTFQDRKGGTGVLLEGEKGSGKTLLAKQLSILGLQQNYPTILINFPYSGELFNTFISQMTQPAVIIFDEFEKIYTTEQQEQILTLFDGVYTSQKLFIITCNDQWKLDRNIINRPGRMYYRQTFDTLDPSIITEYCEKHLKNQDYANPIVMISQTIWRFSFDMLKALVEESNRYGESPFESINYLNVSAENYNVSLYNAALSHKDKSTKLYGVENETVSVCINNPNLSFSLEAALVPFDPVKEDWYDLSPEKKIYAHFTMEDLVHFNKQTKVYTFVNGDGHTCTLTKAPEFAPKSLEDMYHAAY